MTIRNIVNKNVFKITPQEWDVIVNNGNAYKYEIIDDGAPMEVKSMRAKEVKKTLPVKPNKDEVPVTITKKTKKQE